MKFLVFFILIVNFAWAGSNCGVATIGIMDTYTQTTPVWGDDTYDAQMKIWLKNYMPDVNVSGQDDFFKGVRYVYVTGENRHLTMSFVVHRYHGYSDPNENKISLGIILYKQKPDATMVKISEFSQLYQGNEVNKVQQDVYAFFSKVQQLLLDTQLPTSVQYKVSEELIDENSGNVDVVIEKLNDRDGQLPVDDHFYNTPFFCFKMVPNVGSFEASNVFTETDWNPDNKVPATTYTLKYKTDKLKQECKKKEFNCKKPEAKFKLMLTKAFGVTMNREVTKLQDKKIKMKCPRKIQVVNDDIEIAPGQMQKSEFIRALGIEDSPIEAMDLWFKATPSNIGSVKFPKLQTNSDGKVPSQRVSASSNARDGQTFTVEIEACKGTDEYFAAIQQYVIVEFPTVTYTLNAKHNVNKYIHAISYGDKSRFENTDELRASGDIKLKFTVEFKERHVRDYSDPNTGFKGKVVQYIGKTNANLSVSPSEVGDQVNTRHGYFDDYQCGRMNVQNHDTYHQWTKFNIMNNRPEIDVYYHHYIADADSPVSEHMTEGLMFLGNIYQPAASLQISLKGTKYRFMHDSCSIQYETDQDMTYPAPVSLMIGFPLIQWSSFGIGCFGIEEYIQELVTQAYRPFYLKVGPDNRTFKNYSYSQDIALGRDDVKECYDPSSVGQEVTSASATGQVSIDIQAQTTRGVFNLTP
jgi:hypothetical protein